MQQVTIEFCNKQPVIFYSEWFFATSNERILQVTSDLLQRATSATHNKQILQQVTSISSTD